MTKTFSVFALAVLAGCAAAPGLQSASGYGPTTTARNDGSGYFVQGDLGNVSGPFLVDTGSTLVALPKSMVAGAGDGVLIDPSVSDLGTLADGTTQVNPHLIIRNLRVAGCMLHNVEGSEFSDTMIFPILGMDALSQLDVTIQHGKMTFRCDIKSP